MSVTAQCPSVSPTTTATFYESTLDTTNFMQFCDGSEAVPPCSGANRVRIGPSFEDTGCINPSTKTRSSARIQSTNAYPAW